MRSGRWRKVGTMTRRPILGPDGLRRVWEIEFFETDDGRKPVLDWIKNDLTPTKRRTLGSAMRRVLQTHGPAIARSGWGGLSRACCAQECAHDPKELAVRSGVQQAEISKIERGEVVPRSRPWIDY